MQACSAVIQHKQRLHKVVVRQQRCLQAELSLWLLAKQTSIVIQGTKKIAGKLAMHGGKALGVLCS